MPLTHITTCLLCDPTKPKKFAASSMPEVKPGEQPPEAIGKFIQALGSHLAKEHPQALASIQQMGAMFQALLLMKNFQTTDPGVHRAAELTRHFIYKLTQRAEFGDSDIKRFIHDTVGAEGEIGFDELCDFRDLLQENGKYAPKTPEPNRIVTA